MWNSDCPEQNSRKNQAHVKGEAFERDCSRDFHQKGMALLLSPLVLRARGAGQVDLARIECAKNGEWKICLREMKVGGNVSAHQRGRLKKSATLLQHLFGYPIEQKYEMLKEGGWS